MKIRTKRTALSLAVASLFICTIPSSYALDGTFTGDELTAHSFYFIYTTTTPQNFQVTNPSTTTITDASSTLTFNAVNYDPYVEETTGSVTVDMVNVERTFTSGSGTLNFVINGSTLVNSGETPEDIMYVNGVSNSITGSGPTAGTLTTGDISLTIQDYTDASGTVNSYISGEVAAYYQQAGFSTNYADSTGAVRLGNISLSSTNATLGYGMGDTGFSGAYIASTSNFDVIIGATGQTTSSGPGISVSVSGSDESSAVFGLRMRYNYGSGVPTTTNLTINNGITVQVNGGTEGGSTYGFSDDDTNTGIVSVINGDVTVDVEGASEGSLTAGTHRLDGIYETGSGSYLTMNGNVSVTVVGGGAADVRGVLVTDVTTTVANMATLVMEGDISVYLEDIDEISTYVAGLESGGTATVTGDITVTHIATSSETAGEHIDGNIYGVYVRNDGSVTQQGGNVVVSLGGDAVRLGDDHDIYGTVGNYSGGTRTLYFGATDSDGNYVPFTSASSETVEGQEVNDSFAAAFGGFDQVEIRSGSTLYIDSTEYDTLEQDADGITGVAGVITLPSGTTLVVNGADTEAELAAATLTVPTLANDAGTVTNYGTITADTITAGTTSSSNLATIDNYGIVTATDTRVDGVSASYRGQITNHQGAAFTTDTLTTAAGADSSEMVVNDGTLNIQAVNGTSSINSMFGNSSTGTVNIGMADGTGTSKVTVESGYGILTNNGLLSLYTGADLVVAGTLWNYGSLYSVYGDNTVTVEVSGIFNNTSTGQVVELTGNLNIAGGVFNNQSGATFSHTYVTTVSNSGQIVNASGTTMQFYYLEVTSGSVTGGNIIGLTGEPTTTLNVGAGGEISATTDNVIFTSVTNAGSIAGVTNLMLGQSTYDTTGGAVGVVNYGTLTNSGTTNVTNLVAASGSAITNNGTGVITVGSLLSSSSSTTAGLTGVTYTQNDTAHINITSGWFTGSTLNIFGGYLDTSEYADAPTASVVDWETTTTSGSTSTTTATTLGTNTVNISLSGATMPSAGHVEPEYSSNMTVVTTEAVTADTLVTIEAGGVLVVDYIDLTGASETTGTTLNISGGALQTSLIQIFEDVTLEAIRVDAKDPETGTVEVETDVYATAVGDVRESVLTGMSGTSGNIVFTDEHFDEALLTSVSNTLSDAGYNLTVNYLGTLTELFTIDTAQELEAEATAAGGTTYVSEPGIVLNNTTLYSTLNGNDVTALIIGETEADFGISMGFKDIAVAQSVEIVGGKELVLVGDATGDYTYSEYSLLSDAEDGGTITVTNGTFTFGTLGAAASSVGWVNKVDVVSGALNAKNGEFAAWTISNEGAVTVDSTAVLHTASLTGAGDAENNGSLIFEVGGDVTTPVFQVGGEFTNNGILTADAVDTTEVLSGGFLNNTGTLTSKNVKVSGTVSNNEGATWTTSGTLTVSANGTSDEASVGNGGEMTVNSLQTEAGTVVGNNGDGTLTISGDAYVVGTLENEAGTVKIDGTLELVNDDPDVASAQLVNTSSGVMTINALVAGEETEIVNDDGSTLTLNTDSSIAGALTNSATVKASGTLTIEEGADVANTGTVTTENLTVTGGSFVTSDTLTISDTLDISGGTLDVAKGTFTVDTAALDGGAVYLGSEESISLDLKLKDTTIGSQVYVANSSQLSFGSGGLDWAETALGKLKLSADGSLLVMRASTTLTDTGSIVVGETSSSDGLYFAGDSTLVVDVDSIGSSIYSSSEESKADSAVFVTSAEGATATVDSGAQLVLVGSLTKEGRYDITKGYTSDLEGWKDKFTWGTKDGTVYGLDSSGVGWELAVKTDDDGDVYVVAIEHDDVSDNYDVSIPNIVNEDLNDCSSNPSASAVCGILRDDSLSKEDKEKAINSMSNLLFAGGVMATAMTDATAAFDSVVNHLTMDSDTFDRDGNLWPWDKSGNLWLDVTGSWQHSKHLEATKISGYKYRTNSYGFVLGYDQKLTDRPVVLGAAFSFSDGNLKSKGGVSKTKNEYQTYGLSLFGNYSPSPYYNIIGSLHWFHNSADVKQYTSAGKAAAQIQTNLLAVGLRGETTIKAGQVNIVPHVETRYLYGKTSKFNTKLDGTKLWRTNPKGTNTVQFPVGVAFRGDIKTESGWNFRPRVDLTAIPQVGNTKQKSVVWSNGVSDTIDGQFMGKFGGSVKVGMQADKGNATVGVRYGFLGGTKGRADHSVMLQGRYRF